jgi:hypothetical protein
MQGSSGQSFITDEVDCTDDTEKKLVMGQELCQEVAGVNKPEKIERAMVILREA